VAGAERHCAARMTMRPRFSTRAIHSSVGIPRHLCSCRKQKESQRNLREIPPPYGRPAVSLVLARTEKIMVPAFAGVTEKSTVRPALREGFVHPFLRVLSWQSAVPFSISGLGPVFFRRIHGLLVDSVFFEFVLQCSASYAKHTGGAGPVPIVVLES
jgi:hypothetical protein